MPLFLLSCMYYPLCMFRFYLYLRRSILWYRRKIHANDECFEADCFWCSNLYVTIVWLLSIYRKFHFIFCHWILEISFCFMFHLLLHISNILSYVLLYFPIFFFVCYCMLSLSFVSFVVPSVVRHIFRRYRILSFVCSYVLYLFSDYISHILFNVVVW